MTCEMAKIFMLHGFIMKYKNKYFKIINERIHVCDSYYSEHENIYTVTDVNFIEKESNDKNWEIIE